MLWKLRTLDARAKTDILFVFVGYRLCIRHALPSGHKGQSVTCISACMCSLVSLLGCMDSVPWAVTRYGFHV